MPAVPRPWMSVKTRIGILVVATMLAAIGVASGERNAGYLLAGLGVMLVGVVVAERRRKR